MSFLFYYLVAGGILSPFLFSYSVSSSPKAWLCSHQYFRIHSPSVFSYLAAGGILCSLEFWMVRIKSGGSCAFWGTLSGPKKGMTLLSTAGMLPVLWITVGGAPFSLEYCGRCDTNPVSHQAPKHGLALIQISGYLRPFYCLVW
jgi:hypothetical protein